jgi:hypothetical protein
MSRKDDKDSAGRRQPSKYLRTKRAANAAKHRWKEKYQLVPGVPKSWSERSYGNKLKHLAAARKGGAKTGSQIKEQQGLFWRFYHGNCKAQLQGPFTVVVETFERIEAAYVQRYGYTGPKWLAWDGFFAQMLYEFVFSPCWTKEPEVLEREMWELYQKYMEADDNALWQGGLLSTLNSYEERLKEKKLRIAQWRAKRSNGETSKSKKTT